MEGMQKNYRLATEIEKELKHMDLETFLEFDHNGRYEFAMCERCDGPLLGHMEVKCCGKEDVRYGSEGVWSFKNWKKRVSGFREAVVARENKNEEIRAGMFSEAMILAMESKEQKNRPDTTMQLVKS